MNQLLVKDDKSISLEPLVPKTTSQVGSFHLGKLDFCLLTAERLFGLFLCNDFLLDTFFGDKGADRVVDIVLEKDKCALSWQAQLVDATAHPLNDLVNGGPIDSHATVSPDYFTLLLLD